MTKRRNVGSVEFECPNCGCGFHSTLWEDVEGDGCVGAVASDVVVCKCGAEVFCADDFDDVHVFWLNKREFEEKRCKLWLQTKPHIRPVFGRYYDLVRVPHGHVPVGKVWLWRSFPLLVREIRDDKFFKCPECGHSEFFKNESWCRCCGVQNPEFDWEAMRRRAQNRRRRAYFRNLAKQVEVLVLPVLAFCGLAWYVRSERLHFSEKRNGWRRYL